MAPPRSWRERWFAYLARNGGRARTIPVLAALSIGDVLLPALPTQASVTVLGLLQPRRGPMIALAFALAAAIGMIVLALALAVAGTGGLVAPALPAPADEGGAIRLAREYGPWAVLVASLLPAPPRVTAMVCLALGAPAWQVVAAAFVGKWGWFSAYLWLLRRAPRWLMRLPWVGPPIAALAAYSESRPQ